jgi:hypothetical protein
VSYRDTPRGNDSDYCEPDEDTFKWCNTIAYEVHAPPNTFHRYWEVGGFTYTQAIVAFTEFKKFINENGNARDKGLIKEWELGHFMFVLIYRDLKNIKKLDKSLIQPCGNEGAFWVVVPEPEHRLTTEHNNVVIYMGNWDNRQTFFKEVSLGWANWPKWKEFTIEKIVPVQGDKLKDSQLAIQEWLKANYQDFRRDQAIMAMSKHNSLLSTRVKARNHRNQLESSENESDAKTGSETESESDSDASGDGSGGSGDGSSRSGDGSDSESSNDSNNASDGGSKKSHGNRRDKTTREQSDEESLDTDKPPKKRRRTNANHGSIGTSYDTKEELKRKKINTTAQTPKKEPKKNKIRKNIRNKRKNIKVDSSETETDDRLTNKSKKNDRKIRPSDRKGSRGTTKSTTNNDTIGARTRKRKKELREKSKEFSGTSDDEFVLTKVKKEKKKGGRAKSAIKRAKAAVAAASGKKLLKRVQITHNFEGEITGGYPEAKETVCLLPLPLPNLK